MDDGISSDSPSFAWGCIVTVWVIDNDDDDGVAEGLVI